MKVRFLSLRPIQFMYCQLSLQDQQSSEFFGSMWVTLQFHMEGWLLLYLARQIMVTVFTECNFRYSRIYSKLYWHLRKSRIAGKKEYYLIYKKCKKKKKSTILLFFKENTRFYIENCKENEIKF